MSEFFSSSSSSSKCEEIICKESNPYSKYQKYVSIFEQNEENPEEAYKSREESKKEKNETNNYYRSCPNDKQSLGFFTWNYLHTMAIYYPSHPTEKEKNGMKHFIEGVAMFYPCKVCAIDFQKNIKINPPKVNSREDLSIWFCEQHNEVNEKLGKPLFDCSYINLEKRWKTGYEHCKDNYKLQ